MRQGILWVAGTTVDSSRPGAMVEALGSSKAFECLQTRRQEADYAATGGLVRTLQTASLAG